MNLTLTLNKQEKYILACSYGPDSMCLFSLLLKGGYNFIIAHVNYHLRSEEPEEMKKLTKICQFYKIPLDTIDVMMPKGVNEEGWARDVRYDYFVDVSKRTGINNILIAHNEDDLLETYFLQMKRGNLVSYYGLKSEHNYKGVKIIRPLLGYKKADLQNYCDENDVPYGIDLSNFDTSYKRNKIRKEIVKNMGEEERRKYIIEINDKNKKQQLKECELSKLIRQNSTILVNEACMQTVENLQLLLILLFEKKGLYYPISQKFVEDFKCILVTKTTWHKKIMDNVYLAIDYGVIGLYILKQNHYEFNMNNSNNFFKINKCSKNYKEIQNKELIIKNGLKTNEEFTINNITKKVRRCFIDWKVPYVYRLLWPGIYDENGHLLYVPHYQKEVKITKDSLLLFDLNDFLK